jgi:hypothetical protein
MLPLHLSCYDMAPAAHRPRGQANGRLASGKSPKAATGSAPANFALAIPKGTKGKEGKEGKEGKDAKKGPKEEAKQEAEEAPKEEAEEEVKEEATEEVKEEATEEAGAEEEAERETSPKVRLPASLNEAAPNAQGHQLGRTPAVAAHARLDSPPLPGGCGARKA